MKRIISVILLILLLAIPLASCNNQVGDAQTSDSESSEITADTTAESTEKSTSESTSKDSETTSDTSKETDEESSTDTEKNLEDDFAVGSEEIYDDGLIRLSSGSKALYRVVRSNTSNTKVTDLAKDLTKSLNALDCGATFELKTDTYPLKQYLEILIGDTSFAETKTVISELGVGGWAVRKIGGKIVIYGTTTQALNTAITYFNASISVNSEGDAVIDLKNGGLTYKGEPAYFGEERPLESFTIVYGNPDLLNSATLLKDKLKELFKVDLPIKHASEAATDNEILIGTCARDEATAAIANVSKENDGFVVKISGSKLILAGHSITSSMVACNLFMTNYLNDPIAKTIQVTGDLCEEYDSSFGDVESKRKLADGAEVRIMSFNVLSERWCDYSAESRKGNTAGTVLAYMPDVIGFQEFDEGHQKSVMALLGDYELINAKKSDNSVAFNGIAYNKTTLTLISKGYVEYQKTAQARYHKYLSYGVFSTKSTGETFAVINLHWDATKNDYKMLQCDDTVALIQKIRSENGDCPVFVTGDYNANRHSDYFKALLTNADMLHSEITAATKINDEYNTYHGIPFGTLPGLKDTSIDHVVHTKNSTALLYKVIIDIPTLYASDHCPVIADFALN